MITLYGDWIETDLTDEHLWNRYLNQHIDAPDAPNQQFTGHPQLDSSIFKYFKSKIKLDTFDNYSAGNQNVVIIGLHGGWYERKLELIKEWFHSQPGRKQAWDDPSCQIVLDYSEEGFTTEVFTDIWVWIEENHLVDRVLYICSSTNVSDLYAEWCMLHKIVPNMRTVWYGFFIDWVIRDRHIYKTHEMPVATWKPGSKRYMCLNRRPWQHRLLLTALLERSSLIESGAVSLPKDFYEPEVSWQPDDFDILYQWDKLKDRFNGLLDGLDPSFQRLYNKLPLVADTDNFGINYALDLNEEYYAQFPVNVVSETLFFTAATFLSEKIWKPMLLGQIFVVMSGPLYLEGLRKLGFKTFSPWVDEEYDLMFNPIERALAVTKTIKKIVEMSDEEFSNLLKQCQPALEHNRKILMTYESINKIKNLKTAKAIESYWSYQKNKYIFNESQNENINDWFR
jgi:hypothetical protein